MQLFFTKHYIRSIVEYPYVDQFSGYDKSRDLSCSTNKH